MPFLGAGSGVELHHYDDDFTDPWQSVPTLLLQHGFSRSGKSWCNWVPLLSGELRVLRPNMRGMGGSVIEKTNSSLPWTSLSMIRAASSTTWV